MPFTNKIRLPFKITRPQFKSERNVFRKADGSFKTMSAIIQKNYEGETDWLPEKWHERLQISLNHDNVTIEGDKYIGGISPEGDYDIEWQEFLDYPIAKAKFKVNVTPFAASNHNCQTCEEATQLTLTDDVFKDAYDENLLLEEETTYEINVAANDDICCYPAVFSITSFDTAYLSAATLSQAGLLSITTKDDLVTANSVRLVTYRVTCPNGGYDEATVTGDINGTTEGCLAPGLLNLDGTGSTSADASWTEAVPGSTYYWELYEGSSPIGTPVQTGTVVDDELLIEGLTEDTDYYFQIRTVCDAMNSDYVFGAFSTLPGTEVCGEYRLMYIDDGGIPANFTDITYLDCTSTYQTVRIYHANIREVCMSQTSPGVPQSIWSTNGFDISYLGLC